MEDAWAEIYRRANERLRVALADCSGDLTAAQIGHHIWIHLVLDALQPVVWQDELAFSAIRMLCRDIEGLGVIGTCRKYRVPLLLPLATISVPVLN